MKKIIMSILLLSLSSLTWSDDFNHDDHNDPYWHVSKFSIFNCGSLVPLSSCAGSYIESVTQQACRDLVNDESDPYLPFGEGYYHTVQSNQVKILFAERVEPGQGYYYSLDVEYECTGYYHCVSLPNSPPCK